MEDTNRIIFYVNGTRQELVEPSPGKTLLTFLRDDLRLTGTKFACGEGGCGACTVTLSRWDHRNKKVVYAAINACLAKVCSLHGCSITTVEGLGSVKKGLHPVQERIYKAHGSQCGFCTPGMVMSMSSMLRQKSELELEDVELALQGNLCRCTGYRPIIEGFRTLCKGGNDYHEEKHKEGSIPTFNASDCQPYTSENDPEFPSDLINEKSIYLQSVRMKPKDQVHWYIPHSIGEVLTLRQKYKNVEFLAGGTGKFKIPESKQKPDAIIQLTNLDVMYGYKELKDGIEIGASTTMAGLYDICIEIIKKHDSNQTKVFSALAKLLKTWVTAQVRNVATIGGHIGWAHPCSDIIPILMATGSYLNVLTVEGPMKKVSLDGSFFTAAFQKKLCPKDLIMSLVIPFSERSEVVHYYRRARRKEFDLPIANAAFFATIHNNKIRNVKLVAGGMEGAFPGAKSTSASFLPQVMEYINEKGKGEFDKRELARKVFADVFADERSPGQLSNYRRCLVAVFVERFFNDVFGMDSPKKEIPMKSHQLYEKVNENQPESDPICRPIPHNWAAEQATGEANFLDDMRKLEGEVRLIVLQSPIAQGKIKKIDFSEALKVPGIIGYVTEDDIPGKKMFGTLVHDESVMASSTPMYVGQLIGGLLCEDEEAGKKARALVKIDYEEEKSFPYIKDLKNTDDLDHLIAPKFNLKRDQKVNFSGKICTSRGTVYLGGQDHFYLETQCGIAIPSKEKDEMTVIAATQGPTNLQTELVGTLGVPKNKVMVQCKRVGGGFGGKERSQVSMMAAVAAKKYNRPVRGILSRHEDMTSTGHRHDLEVDYELSVDETGRIVHASFNVNVNGGCSADLSYFWTFCVLTRLDGGYCLKNFDASARVLRTNCVSSVAMRGYGGPEAMFAIETALAHLAHEHDLDLMRLKQVNLLQEGDMIHYGDYPVEGSTQQECWDECMAMSNYEQKRKQVEEFNRINDVNKRGLHIVPIKFNVSLLMKMLHQGGALVMIYNDGSVKIAHGGVEMGQGLHTKLLQVASKALGVPMEKIHSWSTSTEMIPNTTVTAGSTGADFNGAALLHACEQINERLEPIKKSMPGKSWEEWIGAAYMDCINLSAFGFFGNYSEPIDFDLLGGTHLGKANEYFTYGAGCVMVEVNCHTGATTVLSADLVVDVGRSLNPAIDIGQIEGAFIQGLGYCTTEQLIRSPKDGEFLTTGPGTYKIPTVADIPKSFNVTLLKHQPGRKASAVYSSKGIGEPPMLLAMGIPLAIREAITSYRKDHGFTKWYDLSIPLTVDKIRMAATDEYVEIMTEKSKLVPESDKIGLGN